MDQGAGQAEFLFHPAGQVARQATLERRQVAERQEPLDSLLPLFPRNAEDVGIEVEVLHDSQVRIEPEPLTHVADLLFYSLGLVDDVQTGHPGIAGAWLQDRRQQPHGGCFSGPVRSDQAEDLPLRHVQRQIADRGEIPESLAQAFGSDCGHGGGRGLESWVLNLGSWGSPRKMAYPWVSAEVLPK